MVFLSFAFALVCFCWVWVELMRHFCMFVFAAILLLSYFQILTTNEEEDNSLVADMEQWRSLEGLLAASIWRD